MKKNEKYFTVFGKNETKKEEKTWSWRKYSEIIHSIHEDKKAKKKNRRKEISNFIFKLAVVFIGSALTTLAFDLLLRPNGIYNSGLSGLLQTFFNWISGNSELVRANYGVFLFGVALIINLIIITILRAFYHGKQEILSTAIFYSIFQLFWTKFFEKLELNRYLFVNFVPENWSAINQKQAGFTLPFYVAIAIGAALVHTFGYSLIFQAKATPGGLDIVSSHLTARKKNKLSLSFFFKAFGFLIVLSITIINFLLINDNIKIKKAELKTYLIKKNKELQTSEQFATTAEEVDEALIKWENEYEIKQVLEQKNQKLADKLIIHQEEEKKKKLAQEINTNQVKIKQIESQNSPLGMLLKRKIGSEYFDEWALEEYREYFQTKKELIESLKKRIDEFQSQKSYDQKQKYLEYLKFKLERAEREKFEMTPLGYLKYITNNEGFWATVVYIFFSSLLINQMFPKDIRVVLTVQTSSRAKLDKILSLLKEYSPSYYVTHPYEQKKAGEERTIYVVNCFMSKWTYHLLQKELKSLETDFFINETS